MDEIRLKFINNFILYNKNISTELFILFNKISKKWHTKYNKYRDKKQRAVLKNESRMLLHKYNIITSDPFEYNYNNISSNKIKKNYIFKYKVYNILFYNILEVLHTYNILVKKGDFLELSSSPYYYESINYYEKKYKKYKKSNYDLIFFNKFLHKINNNDKLYFYKKIKVNINYYDGYFDTKFLNENQEKKYDNIFSNLSNNPKKFKEDFREHADTQLIFNTLLYSVLRLHKNGNLVINVHSVTTKPMADILLIGKMMFKEVHLYKPKIHNLFKKNGTVIIFMNFIEINDEMKKKLFDIFNKLYENDPTAQKFNIKEYDSKYENLIINKINKSNKYPKYIGSFLDLDSNDEQYKFIVYFNTKRYYESSKYIERILDIENKGQKYIENFKKDYIKVQYISSILWAKEFDMETYKVNQYEFTDILGKTIIKDLYSYHEPIIFRFKKYEEYKNIEIPESIYKLVNDYHMTIYMIDTRDPEIYDKVKGLVRFYKPTNKPYLELGKYIEKEIGSNIPNSQAWIKMYEMLTLLNLFDINIKTLKTFHLCELPGGFILATNHYAFTKTNIKKFDWNAQSFNPKVQGINDIYNLSKNYPDKWHWGKDGTGNIMNSDNIKSYKKYCKDIHFITSDCGLGYVENNKTLINTEFAHTIAILYLLPIGGNFVAKFVLPIEDNIIISSIYLYYLHFEEIIFYKSIQNMYSGEFYIIGKNYKGIDNKMMELLFKMLDNYKDDIELNKKYSEEFIIQLEKGLDILTSNFTFSIDRQLYYVDNYEYLKKCGNKCHFDKMDQYIIEKNKDWMKFFNLSKIDKKYLINTNN